MERRPRPEGFEKIGRFPGDRVRFWREHRGMSRRELADLVGCAESTISDLELKRTKKGTNLGDIAKHLGLNLRYVKTGEGEPEADPTLAAPDVEDLLARLFPDIPRTKLARLNRIELSYAQAKLLEAIADIEEERRKGRSA